MTHQPRRTTGKKALLALLVLATEFAGQVPLPPDDAVPTTTATVEWIRRLAIPLRSVEPGEGSASFEPLRRIAGKARIVALGEATHGTREFVLFHQRLTEFLVTEMGFTLFAIEGPANANGPAINEYVLNGGGDALSALQAWRVPARTTREMLSTVEWMRRYNSDSRHTRKVKFFGLDLFPLGTAREGLLEYFRRVDPEYLPEAERILRQSAALGQSTATMDLTGINGLRQRLRDRRAEYEAKSGRQSWVLADRYAVRWLQIDGRDRDCHASANMQWLLDQEGPQSKLLIYAHNGHVAGHRWLDSVLGCQPIGGELRRLFPGQVLIIGTAFGGGTVRSSDRSFGGGGQIRSFDVPPAPEGTLGATLAASGLPMFLLDLRRAPRHGPVAKWFGSPVPEYIMAGAVEDLRKPAGVVRFHEALRDRYDAVLFVARSSEPRSAHRLGIAAAIPGSGPRNLDFEGSPTGEPPVGWSPFSKLPESAYRIAASSERPHSGVRCGEILTDVQGLVVMQQAFDATPYRGRLVRLRASLRTELADANGQAYLYMRVDRPELLGFYGSTARTPARTSAWRQFEVIGRVAEDAVSVNIGATLEGRGRAWIDGVSFEEVEERAPSNPAR